MISGENILQLNYSNFLKSAKQPELPGFELEESIVDELTEINEAADDAAVAEDEDKFFQIDTKFGFGWDFITWQMRHNSEKINKLSNQVSRATTG